MWVYDIGAVFANVKYTKLDEYLYPGEGCESKYSNYINLHFHTLYIHRVNDEFLNANHKN